MATQNLNTESANTQNLGHHYDQDVHLDALADDIHYLILSELIKSSSSDVLALAQSSKVLRGAALPFAYRDIVLTRRPEKGGASKSRTERAYNALIELFRNDKDGQIARHVRSIVVKEKLPEEDLILILNKISEFGSLRKLSWETSAHIPRSVLDILHATWPALELSARVYDRLKANVDEYRQMDLGLLSSPLLTTLVYVVYHDEDVKKQPLRSEWPRLLQALAAGGTVRILHLQGRPDQHISDKPKILDGSGIKTLAPSDITPPTRLLPLHELSINPRNRWEDLNDVWDLEHCRMLRDYVDWSHLRKLNFGRHHPRVLFSTLAGRLPMLKALRFGAVEEDSMGSAADFIESLGSLEVLDIDNAKIGISALWHAIMKHRDTLKGLILRPSQGPYGSPEYMDFRFLEEVVAKFPALERLGWDVPIKQDIDEKYLAALCSMSLKKLDLFLHLPDEATDFAAELSQNVTGTLSPPPLDTQGSKKAATKLMEMISETQGRPLECLTLHFARTGYADRFQPYTMQADLELTRSTGSSENYEYRGKTGWYGDDYYSGDHEHAMLIGEDSMVSLD